MFPVLFHVFGVPIGSYGVSKALAALAAGWLLAREFRRLGWNADVVPNLVIIPTVVGFGGAKVYYLLEHAHDMMSRDFGGSGFTWYGGLIAGTGAFFVLARRYRLPVTPLAAVSAAPLSVAYGVGRLGCLLAGDGTYGRPTSLPWGVTFAHGTMPTTVPVHPTPLYEALAAFAIAGLLWSRRRRWQPSTMIGLYLVLSGTARFLVEILRINTKILLGLTQPQLWSAALVAVGVVFPISAWRRPASAAAPAAGGPGHSQDRERLI
jgi:phosphatidylglycerol:prolipoprotein diacylglycerol transferase